MVFGKFTRSSAATALKIVFGLIIFAYAVARAQSLSMTCDESSTAINYVPMAVWDIMANNPPSANNHILNTLLIKLSISIKDTPFLVRLPNLLALAVYLFFAARLTQSLFTKPAASLVAFLLLVLNPYLIDFFSLGRGYGLSLGFMMGSMYFLQQFWQKQERRQLAFSLGFAILATYSNLTLLNYYLSISVAVVLLSALRDESIPWHTIGTFAISAVVMALLLYVPVSALIKSGELYYGGKNGFIQDTYRSLIENSLYGKHYLGRDFKYEVRYTLMAGMAGSVILGLWKAISEKKITFHLLWVAVLLLMIASNITQFYLLGTRYLTGRTALLYWPAFALIFSFLLARVPAPVSLIVALPFAYHFYAAANLNYTPDWWYDRHTEKMVEYLIDQHPEQDTIRLGAKWIFSPTIAYYKQARGYDQLIGPGSNQEVDNSQEYDYFYVEPPDRHKLHPSYAPLKDFGSGYVLMKKEE